MALPEMDSVQDPELETPVTAEAEDAVEESMSAEDFLPGEPSTPAAAPGDDHLRAVLEAIIYVTDEPLTLEQMARALEQPKERVALILEQLLAEYDRPERGLTIREVAGGFKMTTRPEHHEAVRQFVRNLNPPLKLSLPALETLAVIAYKQPVTVPEIMEIRGVQGAGVVKTLLDRKLINAAGRKAVIGKPILYKTTKEFLVQFGLKDLSELPTLKEFQELGRADVDVENPEQTILPLDPPVGEAAGTATEPETEPEAALQQEK